MIKPSSPHQRIIFPLDLPTLGEALEYVELLKGSVGLFKIGLELFIASGPETVAAVKATAPQCGIFLDLKLHDIPATVTNAMASASVLGADFITVHCDDGGPLLRAAVEAAASSGFKPRCAAGKICDDSDQGLGVLGVTVLTSMTTEAMAEAGMDSNRFATASDLVLHRAAVAAEAGCAGVICSPLEAEAVKEANGPELLVITPGIRSADSPPDDQRRTATPYEAIRAGADYIVVGRPIRNAADPVEAAAAIASEIERALEERSASSV
ncbi:MAG: orotidine-5'-phosphate decarboxylase [Proteobacteria bacterium]|nr:orotidine-5'-phosphate decarboxylase [Pseudomonadota bacterium]